MTKKAFDKIAAGLNEAIDAAKRPVRKRAMPRHAATYTHEDCEHAGHLYYFKPENASPGPYTVQRHVEAIIDIAADGTLGGVELIERMPPPPKVRKVKAFDRLSESAAEVAAIAKGQHTRIAYDARGHLDEIVERNPTIVHLEYLDDNRIHIAIGREDGSSVVVALSARGRITASVDIEGAS